jgi:tRNA modification GTPase
MLDGSTLTDSRLEEAVEELSDLAATYPEIPRLTLVNKVDLMDPQMQQKASKRLEEVLLLSAKEGKGLKALEERLLSFVNRGLLTNNDPIVSNTRHFEALNNALGAVGKIKEGMEAEVPSDLVSIDINQALYHLGEITGEISSDDLLGNIFSNFCIGK